MTIKSDTLRWTSIVLATLILGVMGTMYARDYFGLNKKGTDMPPVIEFTWTPIGRVNLAEVRGKVRLIDDHGLDFTTYRMRIVEADKEYDLPIEGMLGREYEQDISFGAFSTNYDILRKGEMTVEFRVKDDAGQETVLTKVVKVQQNYELPKLEFVTE